MCTGGGGDGGVTVYGHGGRPVSAKMSVTGSHAPYGGPSMPKTSKLIVSTPTVQNRLLGLHGKFGTWQAVSDYLGGLDKGMLCRVAHGKQKPPRSVLHAAPAWVTAAADWLRNRERLTTGSKM